MTAASIDGPLSIGGQQAPIGPGATPYVGGPAMQLDSNPEFGPSLVWAGWGLRDPRYRKRIAQGPNIAGAIQNQDCGWMLVKGAVMSVDEAPATASATNLAGNQATVSGTAMVLAAASAGVTVVPTGGLTVLPTGLVVPAGALILDGTPAWNGAGPQPAFSFFDPTVGIARAVSVTAAGGAAGGNVTVRGYDIYGSPMSETIVAAAGTTVNGKKAFKFLASATPAFTDAGHNYSVGTADIFGLNIRADRFAYTQVYFNDILITANTGFVAAVTAAATATTGDVRGTYATQSASDGVKRLQVFVAPSVANSIAATYANAVAGLVGVPQA